jgi:Protein of unknown function (DUF2971)
MAAHLAATHPELFHYTGIRGLEGIVTSQTLWATHAAFLSDAAEIRAFQARLLEILRPWVASRVEALIRTTPANQALVDQVGGKAKAIEEIMTGIANGIYGALLGTEGTEPFAEPYITSFCSPATKDIAQHGLLSQWRGYGQAGGYAIVFNTSRLDLLLKEEAEKWRYDLFRGDVIYSSDSDTKLRVEFGEDLDALAASIAEFLNTAGAPESLESTYYPLIRCACRYKHWGFHEEEEVRIVAIPQNREVFAAEKTRGLVATEKPRKVFFRDGTAVPCIHLFEGITHLPDKPLPITRIIVALIGTKIRGGMPWRSCWINIASMFLSQYLTSPMLGTQRRSRVIS